MLGALIRGSVRQQIYMLRQFLIFLLSLRSDLLNHCLSALLERVLPYLLISGRHARLKGGCQTTFLWMPNFFPTFFEITEQIMNFSG